MPFESRLFPAIFQRCCCLFRAPKRFSGDKSGSPIFPALLFCHDLCAQVPLNTPDLRVFMCFCHLQRRPRSPCSSRPRAGLLRICPAFSGCRAREWRLPRGPCGRILSENHCNVGENKCFFGRAAKGGAKQKPHWVFVWWRGAEPCSPTGFLLPARCSDVPPFARCAALSHLTHLRTEATAATRGFVFLAKCA